ncbi:uncharacterized protein L969DRAFT_73923 [Mixia osmundae IAM 14324]|uniref:t-SNARE coiled-coil homology domain-containing protein n=1 Tax=Mixia osmundae (strain CBS 9802 / IAM 14324 / JCM 22182 / KY 12970) TaxID=764103 RepID=G7EA06_MIXOS|nr:uncharacterized protein L969DRAFT_73923 [Mixia osmundae IAM 14324]KEI40353.1 hypothetical protein L969DRAFT_73923 [Mixia osmundae IAM 14324]GAA99666.1 hypothetical protein E5Q_06369 [Mixia osmundae IAM 14324]
MSYKPANAGASGDYLEQQNDERLDELHNKIRGIHAITIDIHNDSRQQNTLLDNTSNTFDSFKASLGQSVNKLSRTIGATQSQTKTLLYVVIAIVALFFVWRVIL